MKEYINVEGKLDSCCIKTHITYTFFVTEKMDRLNIKFNYIPKHVTDKEKINCILDDCKKDYPMEIQNLVDKTKPSVHKLNNLLTLSIDDRQGFRGATHNHFDDKALIITEKKASNGLVPGKISEGLWKVTINCHGIYSDHVTYQLKVWGGR